ncbi:LPXTG cell wall anchor domain-containing protein [Enterococcus sp. AZ072]|uniref:LPXTG cell wall anchor domain-containing protein n=1 Tax=unclassified Enterococcus TaxID=2608891 RepID=UPI003D29B222
MMKKDLLVKVKQLLLIFAAFFLCLTIHTQASYAAAEDFVYVEDQYGERWRPGEMTSTNIFTTIIVDTAAKTTADGEKLIAPGTSGEYSFTIHNTYEHPIDYTVIGKDQNIDELPLDFKLRVANGPWITEGSDRWNLWSNTFPLSYTRKLESGMSETINLQWQWPFERSRDLGDTNYGEIAKTRELIYQLTLNVLVETDDGQGKPKPVDTSVNDRKGSGFFSDKKWRTYPQTGESLAKASIVIGFLILFFVFIIFRLRKGQQDENNR